MNSDDLLQHLLIDRLAKGGIIVAGLLVLALGMLVLWRRTGRDGR